MSVIWNFSFRLFSYRERWNSLSCFMAVYVYTTVAVVTSYEFMFPSQQKSLHKTLPCLPTRRLEDHLSAFMHSYLVPDQPEAAGDWSGSTESCWGANGRRCSAGAQAAVPQERRGGNQGSWKAREIPQSIKKQSTGRCLWIYESVVSKKVWSSISKSVVLIPAWSWWWIIPTVLLSRIINQWWDESHISPQNQGLFPPKIKRKN